MDKIALLIALLDSLSGDQFQDLQDQIDSVRSKKGQRGPRGFRGDDFEFDDHKNEIKDIISDYVDSIQDNLKLTFEDLTEKEKETLAFKFEDLDDDQINLLKGPKGPRGQRGKPGDQGTPGLNGKDGVNGKDGKDGKQGIPGRDGKDFDWKLVKNNVYNFLSDLFDENKDILTFKYEDFTEDQIDSFKLKFSDLTSEDKLSLRGPRGLRGQRGKQGIQGETGEKGETGDQGIPGLDGLPGIPGVVGPQGLQGIPGKDGQDGKDAPVTTEVRIRKSGKDKIYFEFKYSDGTTLETNKIKIPSIDNYITQAFGFSTGGGGLSEITIQKDGVDVGGAEKINFEGDNITVDYDALSKTASVSVEQQDTCISIQDEGTTVTSCVKNINFTGAFVTVTNSTTMGDWVLLSDVEPSIGAYEAANPGYVEVNIDEPDAANIILKDLVCASDTFTGAYVYRDPSQVVQNAIATSLATSNVLGIIERKVSATVCDVRVTGVTPEHYTGLDVTKEYYLSDVNPGEVQTSVPTTTGHIKLKMGQPFSDKEFLIMKGERTVRG